MLRAELRTVLEGSCLHAVQRRRMLGLSGELGRVALVGGDPLHPRPPWPDVVDRGCGARRYYATRKPRLVHKEPTRAALGRVGLVSAGRLRGDAPCAGGDTGSFGAQAIGLAVGSAAEGSARPNEVGLAPALKNAAQVHRGARGVSADGNGRNMPCDRFPRGAIGSVRRPTVQEEGREGRGVRATR